VQDREHYILSFIPEAPLDPEQAQRRLVLESPVTASHVAFDYILEGRGVRCVAGVNGFTALEYLPRAAVSGEAAIAHGRVVLPCTGGTLSELDLAFVRDPGQFGGPDITLTMLRPVVETDGGWRAPPGVLRPDRLEGPLERFWIENHPERFRLVSATDGPNPLNSGRFEIYEVRRGP
jgi:hypothetical protein